MKSENHDKLHAWLQRASQAEISALAKAYADIAGLPLPTVEQFDEPVRLSDLKDRQP